MILITVKGSLKMKTKLSSLAIVEHFLKFNKNQHARADAVCNAIIAERQMNRGLWRLFICFGFIALGTILSGFKILYTLKIGIACFALALVMSVVFIKKTCVNYHKLLRFHRRGECNENAAKEIVRAISNFKKLFGRHPEKLGMDGTNRKMAECAKRAFKFENKARLTKNEFERVEWLEAQQRERDKLGEMYDAAKTLMPVYSYEQIFALAGDRRFLVLL